ncbi:MAG TPA: 16S rRNA (cytidine(1402)-2'-O)-methyltransferase [Gammaproteobacteria bacterium]|nr:16S rRNA (cytidine(1402)-2'-O)-methyltransferase [Gammaproteobacteria bacterium]HRP87474.1 16S rRNA (cytidine(1402)-2'-O)-methyltransferase [Gammaproteobacteria bacterium]
MAKTPGTLWVVATPIGNLEDLAPRAQRILAAADLVLCEDTRHSGRLLAAFGIAARTSSLHEHNEERAVPGLVERLAAGENMALISDAGTPLLSDPGFRLVRAAAAAGITISPVPGPSAILAALSVAGLPTDRFAFEGFLPARATARRARLEQLAAESRTLVLFEAGNRITDLLTDAAEILGGERAAVVARELTKLHETVYRGSLGELAERLPTEPDAARGEIVVIIAGHQPATDEEGDAALLARLLPALLEELPPSRAVKIAAKLSGVPRREAYELALKLAPPD